MHYLQLESPAIPATAADLATVITATLRKSISSLGPAAVQIEGELPTLSRLAIDVSGGTLSTAPPPTAIADGPLQDGPSIANLQITGHPITAQVFTDRATTATAIPVDIDLSATGVVFAHGNSTGGSLLVTLKSVADGSLRFKIAKARLETAILAGAKTATASAGVEIKAVEVVLKSVGPRTVDVTLAITVKKFMTAVVKVTGRLVVNDQMVGSITGLKVDGDGMAGSIAAGFIRPHLTRLHDTRLSFLSVGGLSVRDLSFTTTDGLQVDATFGGKP